MHAPRNRDGSEGVVTLQERQGWTSSRHKHQLDSSPHRITGIRRYSRVPSAPLSIRCQTPPIPTPPPQGTGMREREEKTDGEYSH